MKKQIQTGWQFKGVDVLSENYTKTHFFPAGVASSTNNRYYRDDPERMIDVDANKTHWRYQEGDTLPENFEVMIVEKINGKVINTTIKKGEPYYEEMDVEDKPEAE